LEIFINDAEAWQQLALLFMAESDLPRAAFCLEEVLLVNVLFILIYDLFRNVTF
jgi:hypothetical protein